MGEKQDELLCRYWKREWKDKGGSCLKEFFVVPSTSAQGYRRLDGVIVLDGKAEYLSATERGRRPGVSRLSAIERDASYVQGNKVIVVQVMAGRLGMYLLGQALFSRVLMVRNGYKVKETVAVCEEDDEVLRPIAEEYGITVVPMNE